MTTRPSSMIRPAIAWLAAGLLLLGWATLLAPCAMAEPQFPGLTGRVVDGANAIPDVVEVRLTQKLAALEQQSRRQLVVATVPSLQGYDIADYGYQLGRKWGVGDKERNDGVLLLVAPAERKVRIETGYGLEGVLPDGMGFVIINNDIVPRFKAGDLPGGIEAGADAIIRQLTLPAAQAQQIAAKAERGGQQKGANLPIVPIIFGVFILLFFVVPVVSAMRRQGGRRKGGWGAPIVWSSGGGSGSGGSSSGGGGGFSGGGGSFGGGGASGSW